MEQEQMRNVNKYSNNNRVWTGLFLVAVGVLLFANKMGVEMPYWIFSWQMLLIGIGLLKGIQSKFQNRAWIIMVLVGGLFLWDDIVESVDLHNYIAPIAIISVGLLFILRPRNSWKKQMGFRERHRDKWENSWSNISGTHVTTEEGEYVEINSVFGGANKIVLSKNFKGGEINCFMGGAELDLTQADIQGTVILESNQVFGGAKFIVPPHWDVKIEVTTIFGGVEDKRPVVATKIDTSKILIIKGSTIFGGLEIRSY
ncbi:MAG: LiaF domain-containing protein [Panacibacter sp.]